METNLEVRMLPIDQLTPAEYNPRKPCSKSAYRKLKNSLETFGLVEPLIWNETTGRLVGGHVRLQIMRELGLTEVPVSVVRLNERRERSLNVMLNNMEAQGRYDRQKLLDILKPLAELDQIDEFELTGFDLSILSNLELEVLNSDENHDDHTSPGDLKITIVTTREKYAEFKTALNQIITEYDLVTHVM